MQLPRFLLVILARPVPLPRLFAVTSAGATFAISKVPWKIAVPEVTVTVPFPSAAFAGIRQLIRPGETINRGAESFVPLLATMDTCAFPKLVCRAVMRVSNESQKRDSGLDRIAFKL